MKVEPAYACLIALLACTPIFSQSATNTGSVYGKVVEKAGSALSGVDVQLESNIVAPVLAITSTDGSFRFRNLPPGTYSLSFFLRGYTPAKREQIFVSIGERVEVNEILEPNSENSGVVFGTVTDQNGVAMEGVDVTLEADTIPRMHTSTAPNGSFRFDGLPFGTYRVVFRKKHFLEFKRENIDVPVKGNVQVDVQLVAKTKPEKVSGSMKRSSTGSSWTYSGDYLRMLPNGDSIYAILDHTPAIDSDTFSTVHSDPGAGGEFATVLSRGGDYYSTVWNYDGLNLTPPDGQFAAGFDLKGKIPSFFPLDTAEQVQIITAGNDISIPTAGVTVNIVSKQGGREWHGSGSFFFSDNALQSINTPDEVSNDSRIETPPTTRIDNLHEYSLDLGGPIMRDKLFIWGSLNQGWLDRFNFDKELEKNKSTSYSLKANWNLAAAHQFQFGFFRADNHFVFADGSSVFDKPETILPGVWTAQYSWIPDNKTILRSRYGYFGAGVFFGFGDLVGGISSEQAAHDVLVEADRFAENLLAGDHELRFGVEYKTSGFRDSEFFDPPFNPPFTIQDEHQLPAGPLTEGTISVIYLPAPESSRISRLSFYASDYYRKGRLALDIGIRFDRQNGENEPVSFPSPLQTFPPDFLGPGFEEFIGPIEYPGVTPAVTFNNVSPRFGATYDLWGNGRVLSHGSFARYYQPYDRSLLRFSGAFPPAFTATYKNKNQDQLITPDEILNSTLFEFKDVLAKSLYDSHLTNPFVNEYVIGIQTELANQVSISAAFTHRSYHDVHIEVPFGLTLDDFQPAGTTVLHTMFGDFVVPLFTSTSNPPVMAVILRNNRSYAQTYDGFELMMRSGMVGDFMFTGGLALQRLRAHGVPDDFPPWFFLPLTHLILDPSVNYGVLENQTYTIAPKDLSIEPNSEWQLKCSGAYRFPWNLSLGAFLRYQQGYPYILLTGVGGFFTWVEPFQNRRFDNVFTLDLKLDKELPLRNYGHLDLSVEIFNVTNSNPVFRRVTFIEDPNLNMVLQFLSPRVMRLGLRYSF